MVHRDARNFASASVALLLVSAICGVLINLQNILDQTYTIGRALGFGISLWIVPIPLIVLVALMYRMKTAKLPRVAIVWWVSTMSLVVMIGIARFII